MISVTRDAAPTPTEADEAPPDLARLLVVDDHPAVRAGLQKLLDDEADFTVVAAVATAEEAMAVAEREPIDVAVADYQLGSRNGLWLSRKLKRLSTPPRVVIYSAFADGVLAAAAVVAEADAIVGKGALGSQLSQAIRSAGRGERHLPPLAPWLAEALRRRLGQEEQAIFGMLSAGIEPAEIAATLHLSAAGLESRLWSMLHALEAPASESRARRSGLR